MNVSAAVVEDVPQAIKRSEIGEDRELRIKSTCWDGYFDALMIPAWAFRGLEKTLALLEPRNGILWIWHC